MSDAIVATRLQDGIWIVSLEGELTNENGYTLSQVYPWQNPEVVTDAVLFDMSRLSYINSAGIAALIRFVREARRMGCESYAHGVSLHYQKIFRIVGLTGYMELFPDEYGALETLQSRRK